MRILLTGGTGYVGSHVSISLIQANYDIVLLDNFSNSDSSVLERLNRILGKPVTLIKGDVRDTSLVKKTLQDYQIETVIHFAGLKSVGESSSHPIEYYANNVQGTISLLEAMKLVEIKNLIFSSSATVYGNPEYLPIDEDHPTSATNAYGRSKLHIEEMLRDVASSDPDWRIICLRYFNPVGAHESGLIGENPNGIPNNLMPYIAQVARPWGWYDSVDEGERFKVKRIQVKPGASLSLQMHHYRAEHWIVVKGVAEITNGDQVITLNENQSTFIPQGQTHRLANRGTEPLEIIEVQSGSYLGEDDIVRFEDSYGRS